MVSVLWAARDSDGDLTLFRCEPMLRRCDGEEYYPRPYDDGEWVELDAGDMPDLAPGAKCRVRLVMETTAGECGGLDVKPGLCVQIEEPPHAAD